MSPIPPPPERGHLQIVKKYRVEEPDCGSPTPGDRLFIILGRKGNPGRGGRGSGGRYRYHFFRRDSHFVKNIQN